MNDQKAGSLFKAALAVVLLAVSVGCSGAGSTADLGRGNADPATGDTGSVPEELQRVTQLPHRALCNSAPGLMHCHARVRTNAAGLIQPMATPSGLGPSDLKDAYALPSTGGSGVTVGIVDAQDDPNAEADLATYRSTYGLPACTTANGCFKKVNQSGQQSNYPTADQGWAGEIALDIEMVSAACPSCKIILVEATSATDANLATAENTAVSLGATVVSNSYGGSEASSETSTDSAFNHAGVAIFASSGDDGYGVEYPAASKYVTAVGGTSLARSTSSSRGWTEGVWGSSSNSNGGAGSGCSSYETKPSWQTDTGCAKRTVADVSAVADPNTGVAVYDSYGSGGWAVYGGTSVASPLVASIFAVTGHVTDALGYSYSHTGQFNDVTTGTNGSCSGSYLCTAKAGYDGPTGNGTPNGAAMTGGTSTTTFSLGTTPTSVSIAAGSSKTVTVTSAKTGTSSPSIALSAAGLPSGVTASFSPTSVTAGSSSTLTITASASAAAGTSSLTITGTAASETHTATESVTVTSSGGTDGGTDGGTGGTDGGTGGSQLSNGVPVTGISGAKGSTTQFTVAIPAGASNLNIAITGSTSASSDADLYVRFGSAPTTSTYDCRPYKTGSNETCTIASPSAGTYYVVLRGYTDYSGVTLTATWSTSGGGGGGDTALQNGNPVSGISGAKSSKTYYQIAVPSGSSSLVVTITGSTSASNDADLYVRSGSEPTTSTYNCRPYKVGSNETCTITNPAAGNWYVLLNGYSAYSGVTLTASYQ